MSVNGNLIAFENFMVRLRLIHNKWNEGYISLYYKCKLNIQTLNCIVYHIYLKAEHYS